LVSPNIQNNMITKQQAMSAQNQIIHYTGKFGCSKIIGPNGGETIKVVRVRKNGKCQTWKTRPNEFRLPVKYGLYEYGEINERNCSDFHLAADCAANHLVVTDNFCGGEED